MGGGCCIGDVCCVVDLGCGFCCIAEICSDSCCVGYNSGPNETEKHATKIANELADMKKKKHEDWDKSEQEILMKISENMNGMLAEIESLNNKDFNGKSLNIDINSIKAKIEEMKKEVIGYVGRVYEDRLVLTDKELSLILAERDDKKRTKNFDDFCKKIYKQAIKDLKNKVKNCITSQNQLVIDTLSTRLAEVNESIRQEEEAYKDVLAAKRSKEQESRIQLQHAYIRELSALLASLTGNDTPKK